MSASNLEASGSATERVSIQTSQNTPDPVAQLVTSAITGLDAYSRIKNSQSRNMTTDVINLSRELRKKYFIEETAARITIESIAELLGYTPPTEIYDDDDISYDNHVVKISACNIGDIVKFGDFNWRVLDVQSSGKAQIINKALLISEEILEQRAFHSCYAGVTWENSHLRNYLNSDFYNNFESDQQAQILVSELKNPGNHWYGIAGGNDTQDKIFILSLEEADQYFGNSGDYLARRRKKYDNGQWVFDDVGWILSNQHDSTRVARLHNDTTAHAATQPAPASLWWLRTPGYSDCTVAYVSTTGNIPANGDRVCIGRGGVRPAMWVKL